MVAVEGTVHVEVGPFFGNFGKRLFFIICWRWVVLLLFVGFLKLLSVVVVIMLLANAQFLLDFGDEGGYLSLGDFVLPENMGVLPVELLCGLVGVGMEHKFLEQDGVYLFLGVRCACFVVNSDDGRLVPDAQS